MFDIGWGELLVIGVVALVVIGPKELPSVLRALGQWTGKIRRMAGEFQNQFQEALREAEMADLKKQVDELQEAARGIATPFDPLAYDSKKWQPPTPEQTPAPAIPGETPAPEPPPAETEAGTPAVTEASTPAITETATPAGTETATPAAAEPAPPASEKDFIASPPSAPEGTRPE